MSFVENFLKAQQTIIELIDLEFQKMIEPAELWLKEVLGYYHEQGGKRLRPALLFAVGKAFTENISILIPYGTVIELMHTFSLFHDDIIDEANIRRGAITVHKKYGIETAIIAGDILHSLIHGYLANKALNGNIDKTHALQFLMDLTNKVELPIGTAVIKEMNYAKSDEIPDLEEAMHINSEKTGPIFGLSTKAGSYLVGQTEQLNQLWNFGYKLGIAYQLFDDIIDFINTNSGKDIGGDLREKKKTPLIVLIHEKNPLKLKEFYGKLTYTEDDIKEFIVSFKEEFLKIIDLAKSKLNESMQLMNTINFTHTTEYLEAFINTIDNKLDEIHNQLVS
jgi:geranylgeranyl pyrophosphate synthase